MNLTEYKKIKHKSYEEIIQYFIKKNGQPKVAYGKPGYIKNGYECHHIREDQESNLSSAEKQKEFPELQQPENLVYLKYDEHLLAHLLISSEVILKDTLSERREELSKGGINLILRNHLEAMNKKVVAQMLADYCNKISTQFILEADNSKEAFETFKNLTKLSDEKLIENVETLLIDPICFDHNKTAYVEAESQMLKSPSCIVSICTGGGKTCFSLQYMMEHIEEGKKFLVVVPNINIYEDWNRRKCKYYNGELYDVETIGSLIHPKTYHALINSGKYCGVIVDETHHMHEEAQKWNTPIKYALAKGLKVLGLTATVNESQRDELDPIFNGRIVEGLDTATAIQKGIMWAYNYITSLYRCGDGSIAGLTDREYNLLSEPLDLFCEEHSIPSVILKAEEELNRKGQKKGIVFISGTRNVPDEQKGNKLAIFEQTIKWVKDAYPDAEFCILSSHQSNEKNTASKKRFREEKEKDIFLVSYGMVNEGSHYEGVNTLIIFRTTGSKILFTQQLGRIMRLKNEGDVNPNLTVFDFTNNIFSLMENSEKEYSDSSSTSTSEKEKHQSPFEYLQGQDVICRAEHQNLLELLKQLNTCTDAARRNAIAKKTLAELSITPDLLDEIGEYFESDPEEWDGIEVASTNKINLSRNRNQTPIIRDASGKNEDDQRELALKEKKSISRSSKILMSKEELLIYLINLIADRAFICEAINEELMVLDENLLASFCKDAKITRKGFEAFRTSSYSTYLKGKLKYLKSDLTSSEKPL